MTPEQTEYFLAALKTLLLASSEGVERADKRIRLRDAEFQTGARLLWMGKESNGYLNFSHEEAMALCGTTAKSTLRYHLMRLRDAGVLRMYSTNGTVRAKVDAYPGSEMIVHTRTASTKTRTASTKTRTVSTQLSESSESREQHSRDRAAGQLLRAAGSRDRAAGQHYNRNFDDYPNETAPMLLLLNKQHTESVTNTANNNPVEEAHAVALMNAAGIWLNVANVIAKQYKLGEIRRAIGHWYDNSDQFRKPVIIRTWLEAGMPLPELSPNFQRSTLYRNSLTAEERKALSLVEDVTEDEVVLSEDTPATDWPAESDTWTSVLALLESELPASTYRTWLANTEAEIIDQTCTVVTDNATTAEWLQNRARQMILRSLKKVTSQVYQLKFEVRSRP